MNDEHEAEQVDQIQPSENQIKRDEKGKEQELDIYVQNTTISNNTQFDKNNDTDPVIYDEVASLLFGTTLTRIDWVAAQELLNSSTHEDALLTGFKALLLHPEAFQNRALRKNLLESLHSWKFAEGLGLSAKCDDGNKWAQYVKGRLSDEVLRDYETAAHFYELAADQGNAAAQAGLGCLYEEGHGVTQDYTKARHFYELAAEQGYAGAQTNIGNLYREGLGVTQDYAKARHFYELSAEQGHGLAQKHLGSLYEEGLGVTKDYAKARHCYERAADQGDTVAQTNLGYLYLNGLGIAQDYTKARHFYELAAEQGSADAQSNLVNLYANGLGVTQDYAKARHFNQLAAEQGSTDAQDNLGVLFDVGKGGSVNKEKARHFVELAAAQDHADSQKMLLGLPKRAPTSFSVFRRRKRRDESSVQAQE
jgi:TPR repeat protein